VFESVGWGEILVLVVAGLFILGPERLPSAAAWLARSIKQVRDYATGARNQLQRELGPDFEELRKPLEDLRTIGGTLGGLNPRAAVKRALFDDPIKPNGFAPSPNGSTVNGANGAAPPPSAPPAPLTPGERPPIDPDAT
jgi:sec-independent protein translocase protein TatB